ncbi:hypothetical protein CAEBREN_30506 [Caenorhabditis brenneri]|uniref:Uncharacterized protein n=1 Tax=Caenorhabditis brenneri TaxID=135651 RepID=G0MW24_CAEBE|nr:hypothetical protein CAEBREN_30506 [Caenorhabditis brenneri]
MCRLIGSNESNGRTTTENPDLSEFDAEKKKDDDIRTGRCRNCYGRDQVSINAKNPCKKTSIFIDMTE